MIFLVSSVVVLVTCAYAFRDTVQHIRAYRESLTLIDANVTADHLLRAGRSLIFERGRVNVLLSAPLPANQANRDFIAERRRESDEHLDMAVRRLDVKDPAAAGPLWTSMGRLAEVRRAVDEGLSVPAAQRPPDLAQRWFSASSEVLQAAQDQVRATILHSDSFTPRFRLLTRIKILTLSLRDRAGVESTRLGAVLASGRPLAPADVVAVSRLRGEVGALWTALDLDIQLSGDSRLRSALDALKAGYDEVLRPMQDRILSASLTGTEAGFTAADYSAAAVRSLEGFALLMDETVAVAEEVAGDTARRAERGMALHIATAMAILALAAATLAAVRWRLFRPLEAIESDLHRLARGDLKTPLHRPTRADELGALQSAMLSFRNVLAERVLLFQALPDLMCFKDADGRWQEINDHGRSLFGFDGPDWQGGTDSDLASLAVRYGGWLRSCADGDLRAWSSGRTMRGEETMVDADLPPRILDVIRVPLFNDDGSRRGMLLVGHDITERRHAEEALAALSRRLQLILESAGEGIVGLDAEGRTTFVNTAASELTGWSADKLTGGLHHAMVHHSRANGAAFPIEDCPIHQTLHDGRKRHQDVDVFWCRDGTPLSVEYTVTPVLDDGRPTGAVIIFRDIGAKLKAEKELKAVMDELERSNAELEAFAYVTSHDLRQPLRSINGYLQLLEKDLEDKLDEETRTYFGFVRGGAQRMDRLIVDLLEYSRVGRKSTSFAHLPAGDLILTAVENLDAAIREAGATVTIAPDLPTVRGNDGELERLFQNLIGNAIKYRAPDRPPQVRVEAAAQDDHWCFSITDNGIGIAPDDHERIFGIFQRLHRRDEYEGTGIGLAVCRKIVEHHGGRIWVESESGRGSVFHVTLPRTKADGPCPA